MAGRRCAAVFGTDAIRTYAAANLTAPKQGAYRHISMVRRQAQLRLGPKVNTAVRYPACVISNSSQQSARLDLDWQAQLRVVGVDVWRRRLIFAFVFKISFSCCFENRPATL